MKAIKWITSIVEDQNGNASSKRFALFICLFYLYLLVSGSLSGKPVDQNVLMTVGGVILFCIGAVTSEFFKKTNQ